MLFRFFFFTNNYKWVILIHFLSPRIWMSIPRPSQWKVELFSGEFSYRTWTPNNHHFQLETRQLRGFVPWTVSWCWRKTLDGEVRGWSNHQKMGPVLCFLSWKTRWWYFKCFFSFFTPILGNMIQFDYNIFQMGWNHLLEKKLSGFVGPPKSKDVESYLMKCWLIANCVSIFIGNPLKQRGVF